MLMNKFGFKNDICFDFYFDVNDDDDFDSLMELLECMKNAEFWGDENE